MRVFANGERYRIKNARLILPTGIYKNKTIVIEGNKILNICGEKNFTEDMPALDAKGLFVSPGFIDTHVHGGGGHDFIEATPEAFLAISRLHALNGTTALYPTLAAAPLPTFRQAIEVCDSLMDAETDGARIMGLHLEGNYLNKAMCGAMNPGFFTLPNEEEYKGLLNSTSCIKRWSVSPELPGALEFGSYASARGVLISLAHTTADYGIVARAWRSGFTHATHFYNAMTSVHKEREFKREGTVEAVYLTEDMTVELIADGIHVPPAILRLVYRLKGVEKIMLVTDAMFCAGRKSPVRGADKRMIMEDGVCKLADRSALAGSIATTNSLIRTMIRQVGVPLIDAVRMASETPARIMCVYHCKGSLEKGKDADIIIFDDNIDVKATIVEGRMVYSRL